MCINCSIFTIYGDLIKRKAEQGSKIIFLGASGNFYTEYEVKFVSEYLRKVSSQKLAHN